jgi:uncharacterized membrane protein (DUF2068 family)
MPVGAPSKAVPGKKRAPTLYAIIAIKLAKGLLLLLLAIGVYSTSDRNLPDDFQQLLYWLHLDPEKRLFTELAEKIATLTESKMVWFARGTFIYSLLMLAEGVGLMFRARWALWVVIVESAFFIPIEVIKLVHHPSWAMTALLALNILIVCYLYQNRPRILRNAHSAHV